MSKQTVLPLQITTESIPEIWIPYIGYLTAYSFYLILLLPITVLFGSFYTVLNLFDQSFILRNDIPEKSDLI